MITGRKVTLDKSDKRKLIVTVILAMLIGLLIWMFAVINQQKDILDKQRQEIERLKNDTSNSKTKILLIIPESRD